MSSTAQESPSGIAAYLEQMVATSEVLAANADLGQVLHALAMRARTVITADYAAISIFSAQGGLERFVYDGFSEELARKLGDPPTGRGLLGELSRHEFPVRLPELREHASFTGWPEGHPEMQRFLGIPLRVAGSTIGSLYITRLEGAPEFTEEDELSVAVLGLQAAASVANALARERQGRLSLLEERERIAHDLHDGTIQSLYALGLECDALSQRSDLNEDVREDLETAIERINEIIRDIRSYISALEAKTPAAQPDLGRDLPFVVRELVPDGITTVVNITAAALQEISARQTEDLIYVAREALSNAVRHGEPNKIAIDLRQDATSTTLTVQDNGKGFDVASARTGFGTVTMRTRASRLGGELLVLGIPGMGTTVRVTMPRSKE